MFILGQLDPGLQKRFGHCNQCRIPLQTVTRSRSSCGSLGIEYIANQENVLESRDFDQIFSIDFQDGRCFLGDPPVPLRTFG